MGSSEGKEGLIPVAIKEYNFNLFSPKLAISWKDKEFVVQSSSKTEIQWIGQGLSWLY